MFDIISRELFVHEIIHGIVALPFASFIWIKTKSAKNALAVILLSYLLDVDHLFDYFLFYGLTFNLRDFLSGIYFELSNHAYIPFHGWEFAGVFAIFTAKKGWKSIWAILLMAYIPHLILDTLNVSDVPFYFILYRLVKGFGYLP